MEKMLSPWGAHPLDPPLTGPRTVPAPSSASAMSNPLAIRAKTSRPSSTLDLPELFRPVRNVTGFIGTSAPLNDLKASNLSAFNRAPSDPIDRSPIVIAVCHGRDYRSVQGYEARKQVAPNTSDNSTSLHGNTHPTPSWTRDPWATDFTGTPREQSDHTLLSAGPATASTGSAGAPAG